MPGILGILNLTRDSFSDGGLWLDPAAAIARGEQLHLAGADIIDVGAESTHPDAEDVPARIEIERLAPVVTALVARGVEVSVDTRKPEVMRAVLAMGAAWINDVRGLRDPETLDAVADARARLIVMHALSPDGRAARPEGNAATIMDRLHTFFAERLDALRAAGIAHERIVLDPGMGFFVGTDPQVSVRILQELPALRRHGLPLLVSVSRKSFLGVLAGDSRRPRPVGERGAATLAAELFAAAQGVDYIRTHDPAALRDALRVTGACRRG